MGGSLVCSGLISKRFDRPAEVRTFAGRADKKIRRAAPLLAVALVAAFHPTFARAANTVGDCWIGAYRLTDGSVVDIVVQRRLSAVAPFRRGYRKAAQDRRWKLEQHSGLY
jgi:hypothetical protein